MSLFNEMDVFGLNLKTTRLFNHQGISILEVLIASGLLTIIALGVATMIENMSIEQKRIVLFNSIRETKSRIEYLLQDSNAWQNTVNSATNDGFYAGATGWSCLRNNTTCNENSAAAPAKIAIKDSAGNDAFGFATGLLTWASVGSNGFTESGAPCTSFSATAGSGVDACPFSYRLVYFFDCGTPASCNNPRIRIVGRLIFNPSTRGSLNRFRTLIAVGDLTTIADGSTTGKYDVVVERTAANVNRSFRLEYQKTGSAGTCATAGVGQCNTGTQEGATGFYRYPQAYNVETDPFNLVTAGANGLINFAQTGYYECTITMMAFATKGFDIRLYNSSSAATIASGSTVAGYWSQSSATITVRFNVTSTAHNYYVLHDCESNNPQTDAGVSPDTTLVNQCTLGFVTDYANPKTTNAISCYRIDRTFF